MHKSFALFTIVAVCALVILLFVSVEGKFSGCHCYFTGECQFDGNGIAYRYYFCGNCPAYSGFRQYNGCLNTTSPPAWPHSN
ncbi:Uncharacterised protein [uncultured archaeon]|nr:Uncharacterised protein [uncultured archaeon]